MRRYWLSLPLLAPCSGLRCCKRPTTQIGPEELLVRVFVGLAVVPQEAVAGGSVSSDAAAPSREESLQAWGGAAPDRDAAAAA